LIYVNIVALENFQGRLLGGSSQDVKEDKVNKIRNEDFKKLNNKLLENKTKYLVTEEITAADIFVAMIILLFYSHLINFDIKSWYPNLSRWLLSLIDLPHFISSIEIDTSLVETIKTRLHINKNEEHKDSFSNSDMQLNCEHG